LEKRHDDLLVNFDDLFVVDAELHHQGEEDFQDTMLLNFETAKEGKRKEQMRMPGENKD